MRSWGKEKKKKCSAVHRLDSSGHGDRHGEFWVPTGCWVWASYGGLATAVTPAYRIFEPGPFKNTIQGCDEEWRVDFSAVCVCVCVHSKGKNKSFSNRWCGFLPIQKVWHTSHKCLQIKRTFWVGGAGRLSPRKDFIALFSSMLIY